MTTVVCDINEEAVASSRVSGGFTDVLAEVGAAINRFAFAVALAVASSGAAASTTVTSFGIDSTSVGVATSAVATQQDAVTTQLDRVSASSVVIPVRTWTDSSEGSGSSVLAVERTSVLVTTGSSSSPVALRTLATRTVLEQGTAVSVFDTMPAFTADSSGVASSAVVLGRSVSTTALSSGAGTSAVVQAKGQGVELSSQGRASSVLLSQSTLSVDSSSAASGASAVVLPTTYAAWVSNTESMAMSRYDRLPVRSLAVIGGKVLGLGDDGLFEMSDDVGFVSTIKTGKLDFKTGSLKNLGDVVISYVCAGVMQIKISGFGGKHEGTYTYAMPQRPAALPRANRLTPGKGLISRYFQFEITAPTTARFDVDSVTVDVAINTRRV